MSFRISILLIILNLNFNIYSQNKIDQHEEPGMFFPKYIGEKKWKVFFNFDARRSFLNEQQIKINGIRIGANYKGVNRFGIGLYSLKKKIIIEGADIDMADTNEDSDVRVSFSFTTFFYEKVFLKSKRWEISLPAYHGIGSLNSEYKNNLGNYKPLKKDNFTVIGIGINTNFYLLSWLYPTATLGYRFAFTKDKKIAASFTKPFYAFGISLNPMEAYLSYKDWRKQKKQKPVTQ